MKISHYLMSRLELAESKPLNLGVVALSYKLARSMTYRQGIRKISKAKSLLDFVPSTSVITLSAFAYILIGLSGLASLSFRGLALPAADSGASAKAVIHRVCSMDLLEAV